MKLELVQSVIGINQEALDEWIEYRAETHKKMSALAIRKLQNKLLQWDEDTQQRLVDNAIEMDWKGVHWVDPPKQARGVSTRDRSFQDDLNDKSWA